MINQELDCTVCRGQNLNHLKSIISRPMVEVDYKIPDDQYRREIYQCLDCGVYCNHHNLLNNNFYTGRYNSSIDGGLIVNRFKKIINLDKDASDNKNRVQRVNKYFKHKFKDNKKYSVLDIGSGTCVFLYEMKKMGYKTFCIDPDPSAITHAKKYVKVDGSHCGDLFSFKPTDVFDIITFNKVLEHIKNPVDHLKKSCELLNDEGFLYVELPEGDRIVQQNAICDRAEFAVEHYTIYNEIAIRNLLSVSGFNVLDVKVITDPSGKYTIYAFAEKQK